MSTLAIDQSDQLARPQGEDGVQADSRALTALSRLDLPLLVLAVIVFPLAGWPLLGLAVAGGAWLVTRGLGLLAERYTARALARGERRSAMGIHAVALLGRVWIVALAVLIVGLVEREAGLAGAALAAVLFTAYFGGTTLARIISGEQR